MREVLEGLRELIDRGTPFAVATTIGVRGSAPRPAGAAMVIDVAGEVTGSLSGGCIESAVYATAEQVLADHVPVLETYGISDEEGYASGLTCGGVLEVLIRSVDESAAVVLLHLADDIAAGLPCALATIVDGPAPRGATLLVRPTGLTGSLGTEGLDVAVGDDARGLLSAGRDGTRHYGPHGERRMDDVTVFVQTFAPPPRMLVFGAIDFAAAVARLGSYLGYRVTVCDARPVFATPRRFPDADEVVVAWPHDYLARTTVDARTVVCVLTHDPRFDVPLLDLALRGPAAYVGCMGSRRTHEQLRAALIGKGISDEQLARLHGPIGLDLGARTAEETAVSIAADIIRCRYGGSGLPLASTGGRIHHENAGAPAADRDRTQRVPTLVEPPG